MNNTMGICSLAYQQAPQNINCYQWWMSVKRSLVSSPPFETVAKASSSVSIVDTLVPLTVWMCNCIHLQYNVFCCSWTKEGWVTKLESFREPIRFQKIWSEFHFKPLTPLYVGWVWISFRKITFYLIFDIKTDPELICCSECQQINEDTIWIWLKKTLMLAILTWPIKNSYRLQ